MAEYEFTNEQNNSIDSFRRKLVHISIAFIGLGATILIVGHRVSSGIGLWHITFSGLGFLALGVVYLRPVDNFRRITTTKGNDVFELMIAMDDLRIAFLTATVLFIYLAGMIVGTLLTTY